MESGVSLHIDGHAAWLTLFHPKRRNAVTPAILRDLRAHLETVAADEDIRCLVIRGEGEQAFSAGYDLRSFAEVQETPRDAAVDLTETLRQLAEMPMPTVAIVNGHAVGAGCELAVTCDIRWAVEHATLGMPPAKLGIVYTPEGIGRFVSLVGPANTAEIFYSARNVPAAHAFAIGLVNGVFPAASFETEIRARVAEIASLAPLSHRGHARMIRRLAAVKLGPEDLAFVQQIRETAFASDDAAEGVAAFVEKRAPTFTGR